MATAGAIIDEVLVIKYYMDEFEKKDLVRYTTDYTRAAPSIATLMKLYTTLRRSHVYFRLKLSKDIENNGCMLPVGSILFNFFTKHVFKSKREFEVRYPCVSQMISIANGTAVDGGCTMMSSNITE